MSGDMAGDKLDPQTLKLLEEIFRAARFGGTWYRSGAVPAEPVRALRQAFFNRMRVSAPAVAVWLRERVLPVYTATCGTTDRTQQLRWERGLPTTIPANAPPLEKALLEWGREWSLLDPWALDTALFTLGSWSRIPNASMLDFVVPSPRADGSEGLYEPAEPFTFTSGWVMRWQTRDQARNQLRRDFDAAVDEYLDQCEATAKEKGWEKARHKRARKAFLTGSVLEDLEWLIRWQVLRISAAKIAGAAYNYKIDPLTANTVDIAVRRLAREIGLTLRTDLPTL